MLENNQASEQSLVPMVYLVDDDEAVLDSLSMLLDSIGLKHQTFSSGNAFLDHYRQQDPAHLSGCIVLDIRMPGMSGLECQLQLIELKCNLPIIFLSGHADIPMAVEAMKLGAIEFFQKPFREQALLDCIQQALASNQLNQADIIGRLTIQKRLASLTKREKQVLDSVIAGHANKVIATELNLSQRTVEIHRAQVMEKMQAKSLAELVTMVVNKASCH
jgi:two-component system, LuxR family, response regulator FixJ